MNAAVIADDAVDVALGVPFIAFILIIVTLISVPNIARLVRWIVPSDEGTRVGWGLSQVAFVVLVFIVSSILVPLLLPLRHEGLDLLVLSFAVSVPQIVCVLTFAYLLDARRLGALGLRSGNFFRAPLAGVVAYVLASPGLFALGHAWNWTLARMGHDVTEQSVIRELRAIEGDERWYAVLLGVAVMPFFEEILFRGFLQPLLVQKLRPALGIALTSGLFAFLHGMSAFLPIFALSCLLGYVMLRTQRLHAAWTVHALHNGLQFLVLYLAPESYKHAAQQDGLVRFFTP